MKSHPPIIMFLAKAFHTDPRPRQEAKSLVEAGYSTSVIAWDREYEFKSVEEVDGVTVHSFRLVNLRRSSAIGLAVGALIFQIILLLETIRLIEQFRQRPILHAHDFNTLVPACVLKALGLTAGLVYDAHELTFAAYQDFYGPKIGQIVRVVEEWSLRFPNVVLTVSPLFAQYLRQFNDHVELIYNCPSASDVPKLTKEKIREQLSLPPYAFIVSFVGSINELFPIELFLEVATLLKNNDNIRFLVVGGGPLASKLTRMSQPIRARLTIIPYVPHETALSYVSASNLTWPSTVVSH